MMDGEKKLLTLDADELEAAIRFILAKSIDRASAQRGLLAAALSVIIENYGHATAAELLRDLADETEQLVLPRGGLMQ